MKNIPVFCFFLVLAFLSCKQLDKDEETETDETGGTTTVAVTGITLDKTSGYLLPGRTILSRPRSRRRTPRTRRTLGRARTCRSPRFPQPGS